MAIIDTPFMTKTAEKPYPLGPHTYIAHVLYTVTETSWSFGVSVFVKFRFRPSTLHHLAGVFKFLHLGDRFRNGSVFGHRKRRFSVDGRPNRRKNDAFSNLSGLV